MDRYEVACGENETSGGLTRRDLIVVTLGFKASKVASQHPLPNDFERLHHGRNISSPSLWAKAVSSYERGTKAMKAHSASYGSIGVY